MNLSNSFTLSDLTFSDYGSRHGIDNSPTPEQIENLRELAQALERVQTLLGYPIHINSAYRSAKINTAVGGSATSAHLLGYAADFTCGGFGTPLEVCRQISDVGTIDFDQLILEYDSWTHLSVDPRMRRMLLTKRTGTPYMEGLIP